MESNVTKRYRYETEILQSNRWVYDADQNMLAEA
jgi:hypothetical protein